MTFHWDLFAANIFKTTFLLALSLTGLGIVLWWSYLVTEGRWWSALALTLCLIYLTVFLASFTYAQAQPYTTGSGSTIPRNGAPSCPNGFGGSGSYCTALPGNDRQAIPRRPGDTCPNGWSASGNACVKMR